MKTKTKHTKTDYILGIKRGDRSVIATIYEEYYDSIASYVLKNSGSHEDAKDIFQDGLMVVYTKSKDPDFKLEYGFHTFLFAVCRNTWLKKLRNKSDMGVPLPDNLELIEEDSFEKEITWRQKENLYAEKFKELGEGCRKVMQMALDGISMQNIATKMGFASAGYAKKRKYKCKNQLLKLIQNDVRYQRLITQ